MKARRKRKSTTTTSGLQGRGRRGEDDATLTFVRQSCRKLLQDLGVGEKCCFDVQRNGNWFILDGHVDSQTTKSKLFCLVPEFEEARWIVDRLRIGPPRATKPSED